MKHLRDIRGDIYDGLTFIESAMHRAKKEGEPGIELLLRTISRRLMAQIKKLEARLGGKI